MQSTFFDVFALKFSIINLGNFWRFSINRIICKLVSLNNPLCLVTGDLSLEVSFYSSIIPSVPRSALATPTPLYYNIQSSVLFVFLLPTLLFNLCLSTHNLHGNHSSQSSSGDDLEAIAGAVNRDYYHRQFPPTSSSPNQITIDAVQQDDEHTREEIHFLIG